MMPGILRGWWERRSLISPGNAWANILIGVACAVCVVFGWRLGLESLGRWYLGAFALLLIPWGALALRVGRNPEPARTLRLAGDILGWAGLVGFAVVGLLLDPAEYPALFTLVAFLVVVVVSYLIGQRRATASRSTRSG